MEKNPFSRGNDPVARHRVTFAKPVSKVSFFFQSSTTQSSCTKSTTQQRQFATEPRYKANQQLSIAAISKSSRRECTNNLHCSSAVPFLEKPGWHSPAARSPCLPSNHCTIWQSPAVGVAVPGSNTSSSLVASSKKNADAENENQRLSHHQAELLDFVAKSMEIQEKAAELLDQKLCQLEGELRTRQKEQDELFEGRLHELSDAFDSKEADLDRLFHEKKLHLENESAGLLQSVLEAGSMQMQRLSDYSQAVSKKIHDAAKAVESFLRTDMQTQTEAIEALPGIIQPMLSHLMSSLLPSMVTSVMPTTPCGSNNKSNSSSIESPCIENVPSVPASKMDPGSRPLSTSKKRKTTGASGPIKPRYRLKRTKYA